MPLKDLDRLRVALKMGIDKLERWSEFRKRANENTTGEADADREPVADAMDEMAAVMEQRPKYFNPDLPASFRFLAEAVRDRSGATKTVVFGAVKSAENVVSFLGQRALGIGKKSLEAVETHISRAVATSLIVGLSSAAIGLSGALPQGWAWLKPLLWHWAWGGECRFVASDQFLNFRILLDGRPKSALYPPPSRPTQRGVSRTSRTRGGWRWPWRVLDEGA
jgi:hypothetical protein